MGERFRVGLSQWLTSATRTVPGGYVVEAAIALNSVDLAAGALVGLDLQVTDATSGTRTAARTRSDPTGLSCIHPSRRGVVRLGGSGRAPTHRLARRTTRTTGPVAQPRRSMPCSATIQSGIAHPVCSPPVPLS